MIGFINMKKTSVSKTSKDGKSRIPIAEVTIEKLPFILVHLYNANRRTIKTLCELDLLFDDFLWDDSKNKYFAEDLNLFFDSNLKTRWFSYPEKEVYFKDFTTYRGIWFSRHLENKKPGI